MKRLYGANLRKRGAISILILLVYPLKLKFPNEFGWKRIILKSKLKSKTVKSESMTKRRDKNTHGNLFDSKCIKCPHSKCIDLFRESEEGKGGELYVLDQTTKKESKVYIHTAGVLLYSCCRFLLASLEKEDGKNSYTLFVTHQCLRDLKASAFLAFCGRYRSAIQLLRPVLENFLTGIYLEFYPKKISEWEDGKFTLKFGNLRDILRDKKIVSLKWIKEFENMYGYLSEYSHPQFKRRDSKKYYFEIADINKCGGCPASSYYNEEELKEWAEIFQKLVFSIISLITKWFPYVGGTEDGQDAFFSLKSL
ncbi:MAG: hypothetical protein QMC85_02140 [Methanocellales archaeon]|nr:hypothetical protein [Methanocellales archaeon]